MTSDAENATERPPLSPPDRALAYVGGTIVLLWQNNPEERIRTAWRSAERAALGKPVDKAFVGLTTSGTMFGHPLRMKLGELMLIPDHPKLGEILASFDKLADGCWEVSVGARVANKLTPPGAMWTLDELKAGKAVSPLQFHDDDPYYVGLIVERAEKA